MKLFEISAGNALDDVQLSGSFDPRFRDIHKHVGELKAITKGRGTARTMLMQVEMEGIFYDNINCGTTNLVISAKVYDAIQRAQLTGWRVTNVVIFDSKAKLLRDDYYLLGFEGRLKNWRIGDKIVDSEIPGNHLYTNREYYGIRYDLDTWDGKDFFLLEGSLHTGVSERARDTIATVEPSNLLMVKFEDYYFRQWVNVHDLE